MDLQNMFNILSMMNKNNSNDNKSFDINSLSSMFKQQAEQPKSNNFYPNSFNQSQLYQQNINNSQPINNQGFNQNSTQNFSNMFQNLQSNPMFSMFSGGGNPLMQIMGTKSKSKKKSTPQKSEIDSYVKIKDYHSNQ